MKLPPFFLFFLLFASCSITEGLIPPASAQSKGYKRFDYKDMYSAEERAAFINQEKPGSSGYQKLLEKAVKNKDINGIKTAIKGGANPNISNTANYISPISEAISSNCTSCIETMLPHVNINYSDQEIGKFPLAIACKTSFSSCKKWVEEYGADVNSIFVCGYNDHRCTILKNVANEWRIPSGVIEYLINKGADPSAGTDPLWNPYMNNTLLKYRSKAEIKTILDTGVDPDYGIRAANEAGRWDIIQLLLESGANPNHKFSRGGREYTLLRFAIRENKYNMVQVLLEKGAKTDMVDFATRSSALDVAMDRESTDQRIVDLLVSHDKH